MVKAAGKCAAATAIGALLANGCAHLAFEHRPPPGDSTRLVSHVERRATFLSGLVGRQELDVGRYCANPVRTELRVTTTDALLALVTLLVYTPRTMTVVCIEPSAQAPRGPNGTDRW